MLEFHEQLINLPLQKYYIMNYNNILTIITKFRAYF
jgi:hypothetical protein